MSALSGTSASIARRANRAARPSQIEQVQFAAVKRPWNVGKEPRGLPFRNDETVDDSRVSCRLVMDLHRTLVIRFCAGRTFSALGSACR